MLNVLISPTYFENCLCDLEQIYVQYKNFSKRVRLMGEFITLRSFALFPMDFEIWSPYFCQGRRNFQ